jgi:hypothetical protein
LYQENPKIEQEGAKSGGEIPIEAAFAENG